MTVGRPCMVVTFHNGLTRDVWDATHYNESTDGRTVFFTARAEGGGCVLIMAMSKHRIAAIDGKPYDGSDQALEREQEAEGVQAPEPAGATGATRTDRGPHPGSRTTRARTTDDG